MMSCCVMASSCFMMSCCVMMSCERWRVMRGGCCGARCGVCAFLGDKHEHREGTAAARLGEERVRDEHATRDCESSCVGGGRSCTAVQLYCGAQEKTDAVSCCTVRSTVRELKLDTEATHGGGLVSVRDPSAEVGRAGRRAAGRWKHATRGKPQGETQHRQSGARTGRAS